MKKKNVLPEKPQTDRYLQQVPKCFLTKRKIAWKSTWWRKVSKSVVKMSRPTLRPAGTLRAFVKMLKESAPFTWVKRSKKQFSSIYKYPTFSLLTIIPWIDIHWLNVIVVQFEECQKTELFVHEKLWLRTSHDSTHQCPRLWIEDVG